MYRFISILFLLLLSAAISLLSISCYWKIKQIKNCIKRALAAGSIDYDKVVIFKKSDLGHAIWTEPHEFRLNGHMYDIFKTDTAENDVLYHCLQDDEECVWMELLLAFSHNAQPIEKNKESLAVKFLLKDLIHDGWQPNIYHLLDTKKHATYRSPIYIESYLQSVFIPPETIDA